MRAFAAVFSREVFARRIVFPVAFAAGFMPLAGSLAYGWSKPDAPEGRILVALVTAAAFAFAFALLFGGSVIAGETSEKRISFYFSRPIPSGALWGGKLLAVFCLVVVSAMLILAPALLTSSARTLGNMLGASGHPGINALALPGALLLLILGAHAAVTVARLRSPWVALDLLLAPALVLLATAFVRSLVRNSGSEEFDVANPATAGILILVVTSFLGVLLATFVQVAEGRTDARRAHGAFSAVFFGIVGTGVALVGGYAWWCASAEATDLVQVVRDVQTAPRGPWVAAGGRLWSARGAGTFLFDAAGGRSLRIYGYGAVFSQDGTRAAWGEQRFGVFGWKDQRFDILVADLASGRSVETGLETEGWASLALSPGGRRLAVRDGKTLSAYDVSDAANAKQLAAFPVPDGNRGFAFLDEDTIRLFPRFSSAARRADVAPADLEITELSLRSKKSLVTGRFDREALPYLRLTSDGRYFVGTRRVSENSTVLSLHDGRTGALVATLATDLRGPQARLLTGDRIAVAGIAGAQAQMKIFLEGEERHTAATARTIELGSARRLVLGGEIAPGRIVLSLLPFEENLPASTRAAKLAIVDVATGAVSSGPDGLLPANRGGWWLDPALPPAEAGSPASFLFLDPDGRLVRLDPASGAQTVLLGKGK